MTDRSQTPPDQRQPPLVETVALPLVETVALKKHFSLGRGQTLHAVDGISLAIEENQILGLVGESGSGKSTFGKTLVGLLDKTSGQAFYRGTLLPQKFTTSDFIRYCSELQMIFQDPYSSLNPRMTVLDIIGEGLQLTGGYSKAQVRDTVVSWLEKVGLHSDHMSRYPHEFSGGQRQRIGIARALITRPKFVVCDEPISALDVSVQAQVINLLDELKQSMGLTMLFIAHDLSMVRYVSDRMAVMYLGALVETGPANDVFFNPKHPYTELLIESNPEPDPQIEKQRTHRPIEGEITSPINIKPGCRFADRCPKVADICRQETPEMTHVNDHHGVACHLIN